MPCSADSTPIRSFPDGAGCVRTRRDRDDRRLQAGHSVARAETSCTSASCQLHETWDFWLYPPRRRHPRGLGWPSDHDEDQLHGGHNGPRNRPLLKTRTSVLSLLSLRIQNRMIMIVRRTMLRRLCTFQPTSSSTSQCRGTRFTGTSNVHTFTKHPAKGPLFV